MQNVAQFRFYEELNDFLPLVKRKKDFVHEFYGNPTIKDAIETIGVPHTEVDLILVNGIPVDFAYQLQTGDCISVYPVFESFDITSVTNLRPTPLRILKFILDAHLGKLARYLRLLGFDVLFDGHYQDAEIARIAEHENRIVLTRDKGLLKNKIITHGYWLRKKLPKEQLLETIRRFDLKKHFLPFTRCLECNGLINAIDKQKVYGKVSSNILDNHEHFFQCAGCQKIYWHGTHYQKLQNFIDAL